jgi:biotin carboxyl carrier protein
VVTRKVVVNGRAMSVERDRDGAYRIDGEPCSASVVEVEPGVWSVLVDGESFEVIRDRDTYLVGTERMTVEIEDPRELRRNAPGLAHSGRQTLTAAMPGKVVRVLVSPGDEVEAGQGIAVVEAMKMQNEVRAVRPGRVVSVAISEGSAVSAGAVLAVIDHV